MAFKLPRIEAAIQMVDNVSAVMRGVRASIESVNAPVQALQASLSSLSREARFAELGSAAGRLRERMGGIGDGFNKSMERTRGVLLGGAGVVAGMGAFLKVNADAADAVVDTAGRIGVATDSLQRFRYVAQLSGSSVETADAGLERFAKGLSAARAGTGEALAPLQAMGVRLTDARGKARSMEDVLLDVSDAMAKIPNEQDRLRVSSALFGKGNQALVTSLEQGSGALRGMFKDFQAAGGPIQNKELQKAAAFNDTMDRLRFAVGSLSATFASQLYPVVSDLIVRFQEWALANRGTLETVGKMIATKLPEVLTSLGESFTSLARTMGPFLRALWWVMDAVGPLQFALGALAIYVGGPFVASLVTAVPAVLNFGRALFTTTRTLLTALPSLLPMLSGLVATITGTVVPAIYSMGVALMTTPVGWVIAGLAALAGAVYLVWRNWDTVAGWITTLWSGVSSFLDTSVGKILAVFVFPMIGIPLLIVKHWSKVSGFLGGVLDALLGFLRSTIGQVLLVFVAPFVGIPWAIYQNWAKIPGWLSEIWSAVSSFLDTGIGQALAVAVPFIGLPLLVIKNWKPIRAFFSDLWSSIGKGFRAFVDFMADLWVSLNNAVSNGAAAVSTTLKSVPIVGDLLAKGVGFFVNSPAAEPAAAPATPAAAAALRTSSESTVRQTSAITVDFRNLPAGSRVGEPTGPAPVSVSSGYAFAGGL